MLPRHGKGLQCNGPGRQVLDGLALGLAGIGTLVGSGTGLSFFCLWPA
jgi:hypothetical protein